MRLHKTILLLILLFCKLAIAQPPASNIYLFDYRIDAKGKYKLSHPIFISGDNKNSYNNQPYFIGTDLFFTADFGDGQTDIFKCDANKRTRKKMTGTAESEYSPKTTPDKQHFSVVRVATDSSKAQQIWRYDLERKETAQLVTPELSNVGYYEWVDSSRLVMFLVGEPHKLVLYNLENQQSRTLKREIGRCIKVVGKHAYFVDKREEESMYIKEINLETFVIRSIIGTVDNSEDFELTADGDFLTAKHGVLYKYNPSLDKNWVTIADFEKFGLKNITRLAVNNKQIALVEEN